MSNAHAIVMMRDASIRWVAAFVAGFVSVLVFHQGMLALLHAVGVAPAGPFSLQPTQPLGVPVIWSLAFWGGVWGLLFAAAERHFPSGGAYWVAAILFGAIGPTLVAWFVVFPLRGQAVAGGWRPAGMETGLLVNGAWGLGAGVFLRGVLRWWGVREG